MSQHFTQQSAQPSAQPSPQSQAEISPKPWLIYALGGGWGHLVRGLSLARLAARDRPVHLVVNSPYSNFVHWNEPGLTLRQGETDLASARAWVQAIFRERDWDAWIIDTFPRGLGGELVEPLEDAIALNPNHRQRCVLIHRDLNSDYVQAKQLNAFVERHYGLVLVPGDREVISLQLQHPPQRTPPWRIRRAEELPRLEAIRAHLNLPNAPLVLVCATGNADEQQHFGQLTAALAQRLAQPLKQSSHFSNVALRCLAPTCPPGCPEELWLSHWPALECLPLATVVVGAGGYNLVQECEAVGVSLVAFAFRRRYDRQYLRVQSAVKAKRTQKPNAVQFVRNQQEAIAAVLHQLQTAVQASPISSSSSAIAKPPNYANGAAIALQKIIQQLQPKK